MNLKIAVVGKVKDKHLLEKIKDYQKRISHDARLEVLEIKDSRMELEGERLLEVMEREKGFISLVLSEEGRECTSREFSKMMEELGPKLLFVIGGPDGLHENVKNRARVLLSLSKMTFTHEMARMFLLEQIYRALSLLNNRKYHRD